MDAQTLIDEFGAGSVTDAAKALGRSRQTIYNWLAWGVPQRTQDELVGRFGARLLQPANDRRAQS